ncbi:MAG: hypothetical protein ABIQ51_14320, partial [Mesorhizobium sp.]
IGILDQMQKLDEEIAAALTAQEQILDFPERGVVKGTPLRSSIARAPRLHRHAHSLPSNRPRQRPLSGTAT